MTTLDSQVWMIGLGALIIGLVVGILLSYYILPRNVRSRKLEEELKGLKKEADAYQKQVHEHFVKTSHLVKEMTGSYRAVYEHLATGAHALCNDQLSTPALDLPEARLLEKGEESVAQEAVAEPAVEVSGEKSKADEKDKAAERERAEKPVETQEAKESSVTAEPR